MESKKPIIYLPVEVEVRELVSKIHLAIRGAQKGNKVIIGQKSILNKLIKYLDKGIYVSGGAFSNYVPFFKNIVENGFKICVLEEEGLITFKKKFYLDMRTDKNCLDFVSRYYLWGDHQYDMLASKYPSKKEKFLVTGNPRFDFLSKRNQNIYSDEINIIKGKYKNFCLVCTCFPSINHYDRKLNVIEHLKSKNTLRTKESIIHYKNYQKIKKKTFKEFLKFIEEYSFINPNINIVIRPHPGESNVPYEIFTKKFKNVFIERNYSVHSWIIACQFLLHHYCTTSIEALALDTESYCIRPESYKKGEYEFPFKCSNTFKKGKDMSEDLNKRGVVRRNINKSSYTKYVKNIIKCNSSKLIIEDINKFHKRSKSFGKIKKYNKLKEFLKKLYIFVLSNLYNLRRSPYEINKLRKIDKLIIKNYIDKIEGKQAYKNYRIQEIGKNLVSLEKK